MRIFPCLAPAVKFLVEAALFMIWKAVSVFHSWRRVRDINGNPINDIIVFQLNYMGDVLLTLPALYAFKKKFPDVRLTIVTRPEFLELVEKQPYISKVICSYLGTNKMFGRRLFRDIAGFLSLRKSVFDAAVDVSGRFATAWLTWLSGSPVRAGCVNCTRVAGMAMQDYGWLYTQHVPYEEGMYLAAYHKKVLENAAGVTLNDEGFALFLPEELTITAKEVLYKAGISLEKPVVCIHPGANHKSRRWREERFAAVADALSADFPCNIIFTGSAGDATMIQSIQSMMRALTFSFAGATTLTELASLISFCRLFISSFTGPMHLAMLLNVPTIGLSCADATPRTYFPERKNSVYIEKYPVCGNKYFFFDALHSQTCGDVNCRCMDNIASEDVIEIARNMLLSKNGNTISSTKSEQ